MLSEHAHGRRTSLFGEALDHPHGVLDLLARSIPAPDPPDERFGHERYRACYGPVQRTHISGAPFPCVHPLTFYYTVSKIVVKRGRGDASRAEDFGLELRPGK